MTVSLNSSTFKIGAGALNLTKDGTASVNASTSKTTTSLDFTSKRLEVFFYIDDQATLDTFETTDCITIRFGSSSGDYYQWTRDVADLSIGWNYINNMTSANADSTTGSPVDASSDFTLIQITTQNTSDTWAAGKVIMDDWRLASAGDFTKNLNSGYPIIDESTLQVTLRGELTVNDANGHLINGLGFFNTDSTEVMEGIDDITAESKDNTDQLIFIARNRLS